MKITNKRTVKKKAVFYAATALICFLCSLASLLDNRTVVSGILMAAAVIMLVLTGRLKYTEIEYGGMFISVKKKDILERSTLPLFEMPCTKIRRIDVVAGRSGGHRLVITCSRDKSRKNVFTFSLNGISTADIDFLKKNNTP